MLWNRIFLHSILIFSNFIPNFLQLNQISGYLTGIENGRRRRRRYDWTWYIWWRWSRWIFFPSSHDEVCVCDIIFVCLWILNSASGWGGCLLACLCICMRMHMYARTSLCPTIFSELYLICSTSSLLTSLVFFFCFLYFFCLQEMFSKVGTLLHIRTFVI